MGGFAGAFWVAQTCHVCDGVGAEAAGELVGRAAGLQRAAEYAMRKARRKVNGLPAGFR